MRGRNLSSSSANSGAARGLLLPNTNIMDIGHRPTGGPSLHLGGVVRVLVIVEHRIDIILVRHDNGHNLSVLDREQIPHLKHGVLCGLPSPALPEELNCIMLGAEKVRSIRISNMVYSVASPRLHRRRNSRASRRAWRRCAASAAPAPGFGASRSDAPCTTGVRRPQRSPPRPQAPVGPRARTCHW